MQKNDIAFVLNIKPYQESSALLKIFSKDAGVLTAVVRNVYKNNQKAQLLRSSLQFGHLLEVNYKPTHGLQMIYQIESIFSVGCLDPESYILISYLNELINKLVPDGAACQKLFSCYQNIMNSLSAGKISEKNLRTFEFILLDELGFEFDWLNCGVSGQNIDPHRYYRFNIETGFCLSENRNEYTIKGHVVSAIAKGDFDVDDVSVVAKKIFRRLLQKHLGGRQLKSRQIYQDMFSS